LGSLVKMRNLVIIDKTDPIEAVEIYSKISLKFIDAMIASYPLIRTGKMHIISYDKEFDKIPGVKRLEPHQLTK